MKFVAANAPREVVTAVRQKGLSSLPADQSAHLPPTIDVQSDEHMTFFKASFDDGDAMHGGMTDAAWTCHAGGAGHLGRRDGVERGEGVRAGSPTTRSPRRRAGRLGPRRLRPRHRAPGAHVFPRADRVGHRDAHCRRARRAIPVGPRLVRQLHLGHGAREGRRWPSLGLSTRAAEDGRRTVIDVEKDSPASKAGIAVGDLIIAIDKTPIDNRETLNRVMAGYQWGDMPQVTVRRGDAEQTSACRCAGSREAAEGNVEVEVSCPYCGEPLTLVVDETGGRTQSYVEDCAVCCQPISVHRVGRRRRGLRAGRTAGGLTPRW